MTRQAPLALFHARVGLHPEPEHRPEDRRLERGSVQQRRIDPTERFEVGGLFSYPFPFLVVPIMALLAVFRSDEDFLDFLHPIGRRLPVRFLRDRTFVKGDVHSHKEREHDAHNQSLKGCT